jgi:hypothetical protein
MNNSLNVPIWEKYSLSIKEAAHYFNIGENNIRKMANENPDADWVLWNNTKVLIKRQKFESYLNRIGCI